MIAAPAGFGKTTLLGEWLEGIGRPVAWLSLDEGDNDPARFLAYLIAALRTVEAKIGEGMLDALQSPQPPPTESVLTALLNEVTTLPDDLVLVLDDYHVIGAKPVDAALTFVLEHLPEQMHLVIATRADPQLSLARFRALDQLTELRAADLRFTPTEAAEFLKEVMGLCLSAADIAALEDRTEGWIAGLQLAALSMRGREDIPGFIRAFAGDNRYIVDYLVEEVLQRQPEAIRNFLLQTAILERLNGPLCDAVTGQQEGNARLEALERGNFFVVPLDEQRHWYRYHHLFADVLRAYLRAEQPGQVSLLHRRASAWYEQAGSVADAIRHALAAEDFERTADLIERAMPALRRSRQEAAVLGWLEALPEELFQRRPVLSVHYAGVLLASGKLEGVESRLRDGERWLDATTGVTDRPTSQPMAVVDEDEFRSLPGSIAVFRAAHALALGHVRDTVEHARMALDVLPEENHLGRGAASGLLGLAYWTVGDLEAAQGSYAECMARLLRIGHSSDAIGITIALADIRMVQGRLLEAMRLYERGLQLATAPGAPVLRGAADMHVGMSDLCRERDDLKAATQHLLNTKELGEFAGLPQNRSRWCVAMARIRAIEGDLDTALELLGEAERLYVSDFFPNLRPIAALRARLWVAHGRLGEALAWALEGGLSADDDLSYLGEFEHITLVRVLLARARSDRADHTTLEALRLLERLLQTAEDGGRTGSAIEILVLQALTHQTRGDLSAALVPLERALTLAEPEGYVRMFVDEGLPMAILLAQAAKHGTAPNYVRQLLSAFGKAEGTTPAKQVSSDPLSERELEVLRLLRTELNGPGMARELGVSLNTLRTHTKNIYGKLGANNRRAAVRRAEELELL